MPYYTLACDGGSRKNPGPSASGFVVYATDFKIENGEMLLQLMETKPLIEAGEYLGIATNNQAEWRAVIIGLDEILNKIAKDLKLTVFLDSELVIRQINGIYKVKNPDLILLHRKLKDLLPQFGSVSFQHVYRRFNKKADEVVNRILDENS